MYFYVELSNDLCHAFTDFHTYNFSPVRPNFSMMKITPEKLTDSDIVQCTIWEVKHASGTDVERTD